MFLTKCVIHQSDVKGIRQGARCGSEIVTVKESRSVKIHCRAIKVVIAQGIHLYPFRTEKLSPAAPMVLRKSGRVGRRLILPRGRYLREYFPLFFVFYPFLVFFSLHSLPLSPTFRSLCGTPFSEILVSHIGFVKGWFPLSLVCILSLFSC